jgi:hypothetical protein
MNLAEIVTNVKAEVGPATNIDSLIKRWANRGQQKFVTVAKHYFSWMILNRLTLTTEVGVSEYALSPLVDRSKLINMYSEDRKWSINVISRFQFQERFPDASMISGDPVIAYLSGYTPVSRQPTSASQLTVVSTSALDTSIITIDGLNAAGVLIREEITLNGITPVVSTNSFSKILTRSYNAFLSGIVTMTSNAGAVTNATISARDRQGLLPKITFYPQPSSAKTLFYDATMRLPPLVTDNDMSLIPEDFHDAIEDYAMARCYRHKKDIPSATAAYTAFLERVKEAVRDDRGPVQAIIVNGAKGNSYLGEGTLPGLFPNN